MSQLLTKPQFDRTGRCQVRKATHLLAQALSPMKTAARISEASSPSPPSLPLTILHPPQEPLPEGALQPMYQDSTLPARFRTTLQYRVASTGRTRVNLPNIASSTISPQLSATGDQQTKS